MEQMAVVRNVLKNGMAKVIVDRSTACGAAHNNCAECCGCEKMMTRTSNEIVAFNDINAREGDVVKLETENGTMMTTIAIVYILPLVLAIIFYAIGAVLALGGEGILILCALLGFIVGIFIIVAWDRHVKKSSALKYHIVEVRQA